MNRISIKVILEAIEEVKNIKTMAGEVALGRLDPTELDTNSSYTCFYGQMFGYSFSLKAATLKLKVTDRKATQRVASTGGNYRIETKPSNGVFGFFDMTPLELIGMTYDVSGVLPYLMGETDEAPNETFFRNVKKIQ